MKKTVILIVLIVVTLGFSACMGGNTTTTNQSWAKSETMTFSISDSSKNNTVIGDSRFVTKTNLTEEDKLDAGNNLKKYVTNANTKVTVNTTVTGEYDINTVYYANVYRLLASVRRYHNLTDNKKDYVITSYHEGKYYHYTISFPNDETVKDKTGKLKVGTSGYTEYEFLYFYIRCFDIGAVPSSIKVAEPFSNSVYTLSCTAGEKTSVATQVQTLGTVACNTVYINNSDTPVGRGITVCYLPDEAPFNSYGDGSIIKSKKMPTKIIENNLVYTLSSFTAGA